MQKTINSLDIEASDLYGYPIQVGIIKENGEKFLEYVLPHEKWINDLPWSYNAQCMHGIHPDVIFNKGLNIIDLANKLNDFLKEDEVFVDSNFDIIWMNMIFEYAEINKTFKIIYLPDKFGKKIFNNWECVFLLKQQETGLKIHDALNDAILNQMTFTEIRNTYFKKEVK